MSFSCGLRARISQRPLFNTRWIRRASPMPIARPPLPDSPTQLQIHALDPASPARGRRSTGASASDMCMFAPMHTCTPLSVSFAVLSFRAVARMAPRSVGPRAPDTSLRCVGPGCRRGGKPSRPRSLCAAPQESPARMHII